ncbi:MAG: hypothetical protein K6T83_07820 [Alicyclobacillus sp.]|nr:hypothetical protein [Alicyclobacillus sp.]
MFHYTPIQVQANDKKSAVTAPFVSQYLAVHNQTDGTIGLIIGYPTSDDVPAHAVQIGPGKVYSARIEPAQHITIYWQSAQSGVVHCYFSDSDPIPITAQDTGPTVVTTDSPLPVAGEAVSATVKSNVQISGNDWDTVQLAPVNVPAGWYSEFIFDITSDNSGGFFSRVITDPNPEMWFVLTLNGTQIGSFLYAYEALEQITHVDADGTGHWIFRFHAPMYCDGAYAAAYTNAGPAQTTWAAMTMRAIRGLGNDTVVSNPSTAPIPMYRTHYDTNGATYGQTCSSNVTTIKIPWDPSTTSTPFPPAAYTGVLVTIQITSIIGTPTNGLAAYLADAQGALITPVPTAGRKTTGWYTLLVRPGIAEGATTDATNGVTLQRYASTAQIHGNPLQLQVYNLDAGAGVTYTVNVNWVWLE